MGILDKPLAGRAYRALVSGRAATRGRCGDGRPPHLDRITGRMYCTDAMLLTLGGELITPDEDRRRKAAARRAGRPAPVATVLTVLAPSATAAGPQAAAPIAPGRFDFGAVPPGGFDFGAAGPLDLSRVTGAAGPLATGDDARMMRRYMLGLVAAAVILAAIILLMRMRRA